MYSKEKPMSRTYLRDNGMWKQGRRWEPQNAPAIEEAAPAKEVTTTSSWGNSKKAIGESKGRPEGASKKSVNKKSVQK